MIRYVVRRILLMIPTFVGITVLTFGLLSIGDDPLAPGAGEEPSIGGRALPEDVARRLRVAMGYDLPAIINLDVEDSRRTVQAAAERVSSTWRRVAPDLSRRVYDAALSSGLNKLEAATVMDAMAAHVRSQVVAGRVSSEGLLTVSGRGARAARLAATPLQPELRAMIWDMDRLRRLRGQTARWLRPVLDEAEDPEDPLHSLVSGAGELAEAEGYRADEMRGALNRWMAAARAEVSPGRPTGAPLEAVRERRRRWEAELARYGGLMMTDFMPLLLDASPHVRGLAAELLVGSGGCDVRYTAYGSPGRRLSPEQERLQTLEDDRLRRWWELNHLRYREVSDLERWGWLAWTHTRYGRWVASLVTLDFGESMNQSRSVRTLLGERLPFTLLLQGCAVAVMFLLAIPLGTWAARRKGSRGDRGLSLLMFALFAAPSFWVATACVLGLNGVFPMQGLRSPEIQRALTAGELSVWSPRTLADLAWHCVLPVAVLSYGGVAVLQRFARTSFLDTASQPWVRAVRARGVPERRLFRRHVQRPSLIPLVTLFGVILPALVGGSVVVERIFGIPGMGLLAWEAVTGHDVPVVMAVVSLSAVVTMLGYLAADLLYGWVDPRVRRS